MDMLRHLTLIIAPRSKSSPKLNKLKIKRVSTFAAVPLLKRHIYNANVIIVIRASHQYRHTINNKDDKDSVAAPVSSH